jgi:hypothetical protein
MAEDININIKTNFGGTNKTLGDMKKSLEDVNKETKGLKQQFIEAKKEVDRLAGAEVVDSEALSKAMLKMSDLKDRMADINEQVDLFATGSKYEAVSNSFGEIGGAIKNLDFGKAQERAEAFAKAAKAISFGEAIKSIKQLGSTFMTIGKALLTNPIFLIAAVIAGIAFGIYKLLDALGLIKPMLDLVGKYFDLLMKPIKILIQGLKDLTDWFGLTAHAATEAAEKQAEASKKAADAQKENSASIVKDLDNQIRMRKLEGESTVDLERKKQELLKDTAAAQAKADSDAYQAAKLKGELSEEEIENLRKVAAASTEAYSQALADVEYFEAGVRKQIKDTAKEQKEKEDSKNKDLAAKRKEYLNNRLAAERSIEDLRISLMENDNERELEENRIKYKRLIEDTKSNQTLNGEEKIKIIDYYNKLQISDENKIKEDIESKKKEELDKNIKDEQDRQDAQYKLLQQLRNTDRENEIAAIVANYETKFELAEGNAELEKELKRKQKEELDAINKEYDEKEKEARDKKAAEDLALKEKEVRDTIELGQQTLGAVGSLNDLAFMMKTEGLEKGSKAELDAAKKQFNINKALQLSTAGITGVQSVMEAYKNGMKNPVPLLGPATGIIYASMAGITSAVNIAKIASSKFNPGGGGGVPSGSVGGVPSAPSTPPQFQPTQFFGLGQTKQSEGGANGGGSTKVYVTETDISKTQNKVKVIEDRAKIG